MSEAVYSKQKPCHIRSKMPTTTRSNNAGPEFTPLTQQIVSDGKIPKLETLATGAVRKFLKERQNYAELLEQPGITQATKKNLCSLKRMVDVTLLQVVKNRMEKSPGHVLEDEEIERFLNELAQKEERVTITYPTATKNLKLEYRTSADESLSQLEQKVYDRIQNAGLKVLDVNEKEDCKTLLQLLVSKLPRKFYHRYTAFTKHSTNELGESFKNSPSYIKGRQELLELTKEWFLQLQAGSNKIKIGTRLDPNFKKVTARIAVNRTFSNRPPVLNRPSEKRKRQCWGCGENNHNIYQCKKLTGEQKYTILQEKRQKREKERARKD